MTGSPPPRAERSSARRLLIWFIIGVVVIAGIALYFRYSGQVMPIIGQDR